MINKKKYVIITPFFPNEINHVGSYIYDQAKTLKEISGFHVIVVKLITLFSDEKDYKYKGIDVKIFKVIDLPSFIFPGMFHFINSYRIRRLFENNSFFKNISIIHAHVTYPAGYLANSLAFNRDIKTIVQHHGIDAIQLLNGKGQLIRAINMSILKHRSLKELNKIDLNVYVSNRVRIELHNYINYKPKDEFVLYNGVDTNRFFKKKLFKKSNKYIIGCVANFWVIKDHISLIKSIHLLINEGILDIELRLVGKGATLDACKKYVQDHNLSRYVLFLDEMTHIELNDFYNTIDLFVLPSYYEALGCVLLEAWATGTVIISIHNQGISELIPDSEFNNLLAKERSPESLKEKIYAEYSKRRGLLFNKQYSIMNTIQEFMRYKFFNNE